MLSAEEMQIYNRQIMIPEIGKDGQERLKKSRVFIAGAGGLGSPATLYLAAAGVGSIIIADNDTVEASNLNRQILHWKKNVGDKKTESGREKITSLNNLINVETVYETITENNIIELTEECHAIVDAMDNIETRFALNKAAIEWNIPLFHGAVSGMEGRAATIIPGKTACIGCMYKRDIKSTKFPVLGVTPGIIGIIQATEVIKFITGMGKLLENRLLIYDGMELSFKEFRLNRNPACSECGKVK